jgi:hypothetical protein
MSLLRRDLIPSKNMNTFIFPFYCPLMFLPGTVVRTFSILFGIGVEVYGEKVPITSC